MEFSHIADEQAGFDALLKSVEARALEAFNRHADARRVYRNFALARRSVSRMEEIGRGEALSDAELTAVLLAGWLLQMPTASDFSDLAKAPPTPRRLADLQLLLEEAACPEEVQSQTLDLLRHFHASLRGRSVEDKTQRVLTDGYLAARFGPELPEEWPYRLLEKTLLSGEEVDVAAEKEQLYRNLENLRYYTAFAKLKYEPLLAKHLLWLKRELRKGARAEPEALRKFQKIERKIPSSGIQTFFRANYRNHINLSSIADNKAHIMISVNAILISVLISIISYKNITESQPEILMPVVIFLITGLTSLIFAVLSARPKVTAFRQMPEMEDYKKNLVFFGKFVARPIEDYEQAVDEMFQSGELLYANLVRDLYNLGLVLQKKYNYLNISYNIFMLGFIATVLTFLLALFL